MYENNMGMIFYGPPGTDKTFLACCIANAILERERLRYSMTPAVIVATLPALIDRLSATDFPDKEKFFKRLENAELVVLDDFGVERETEYALEQTYRIIDARERSGKPLIITTNLSPAQLKKPRSIAHSRIYDRIYKMCGNCPIPVQGDSRRTTIATDKREKFERILNS